MLPVNDKNAARSLAITGENGATRITTVGDDAADSWYDLQGNRISPPQKKGLFIHNGKKEVVR